MQKKQHIPKYRMWTKTLISSTVVFAGTTSLAMAQVEPPPSPPHSLSTVSVPDVKDIGNFIKDNDYAVLLGKALFWDMGVGSDGNSCASCHFHAGVDNRIKNQLSPGLLEEHGPDTTFDPTASGGQGGPNYTLVADDFPFIQFNNMDDRHSGVTFSTNDAASSQGVFEGQFDQIPAISQVKDECFYQGDPIFNVHGVQVRKVEPRNTPSMINAVFNFRNFWDGRANNIFNGVDPFGKRNDHAVVIDKDGNENSIHLKNSSLASQASGPPLSTLEMSCAERAFADIGKKMLSRRGLQYQKVHADDSVLGSFRHSSGVGLTLKYKTMVKRAFESTWWNNKTLRFGPNDEYDLLERNFSLFFGLALQAYQSTLISDQAPFDSFADRYHNGDVDGANGELGESAVRGLDVFLNKGKCINCHVGPEFSGAASKLQSSNEEDGLVERMLMGDGQAALYDDGFYNIGVTPTSEDLGVGGNDPFGNPLSFSKQFRDQQFVDPFSIDTCKFEEKFDSVQSVMTAADDFSSISYGSNDGDANWLGEWIESETNGPAKGRVRIHTNLKLRLTKENSWLARKINLTDATNVTFSYKWSTASRVDDTDAAVVEISIDNGVTWTVLKTIQVAGANSATELHDISAYATESTMVRFRTSVGHTERGERIFFDEPAITFEGDSACRNLPEDLASERLAVRGAFKTPILRNVELTGPFMHNGSLSTLEQVVQFYNRGGNLGESNPELDPDIRSLGLTDQEKDDLVAFLKSLTDERVAFEKAPFDRPQLIVPNGHPGDENGITENDGLLPAPFFTIENDMVVAGAAAIELPPVGANGRAAEGLNRLETFADVLGVTEPPVEPPVAPPADAQFCSHEFGVCTLPTGVTATVWYGAFNNWNLKTGITGSIHCNNGTFGDPLPLVFKGCYYKGESITSFENSNIALGKLTSQSSTDYSGEASRAVDGNASGIYDEGSVTHTSNEVNPWWQVDLGASQPIDTVKLFNRTDCCTDRLSKFYVFVSDTDLSGRSLNDILADGSVWQHYTSGAAAQETALAVAAQGRYVRVQLATKKETVLFIFTNDVHRPLSIAEVEVYSQPILSSN